MKEVTMQMLDKMADAERKQEEDEARHFAIRMDSFKYDCGQVLLALKKAFDWLEEAETDGEGTSLEDKAASLRDEIEKVMDAVKGMQKSAKEMID